MVAGTILFPVSSTPRTSGRLVVRPFTGSLLPAAGLVVEGAGGGGGRVLGCMNVTLKKISPSVSSISARLDSSVCGSIMVQSSGDSALSLSDDDSDGEGANSRGAGDGEEESITGLMGIDREGEEEAERDEKYSSSWPTISHD